MSSQYFQNVVLAIEAIETKPMTAVIDVYGKLISTPKRLRIFFQLNKIPYVLDCFQERENWLPHSIKHNAKTAVNGTCPYCGAPLQTEPFCSFLNETKQPLFDWLKQDKQVRLKLLLL